MNKLKSRQSEECVIKNTRAQNEFEEWNGIKFQEMGLFIRN